MRYTSIDLMRSCAVCSMVMIHFVENLSGTKESRFLPAGFAAPMFSFLSGMSYRLWLNAQEARGVTQTEISKRTVRRGLMLLGLGFAFNVLVWMPADTYNWDVLTFIGAAWLVLELVRELPPFISGVIGTLAVVTAPVLRSVVDYPAYWSQGSYEPNLTLGDVTIGFFAVGYFPFLPWIVMPLAGFAVGTWLFDERSTPPWATYLVAGAGAVLMGLAEICMRCRSYFPQMIQQHFLKGWTMFPPALEYQLQTLGFSLLAFGLLRRWLDLNPRFNPRGRFADLASTFSRHSLTMYILHHLAHIWPLWAYTAAQGLEPTAYWQNALPVYASFPLSLLFLFVSFQFLRWMDRTDRPGIEAWLRWICD